MMQNNHSLDASNRWIRPCTTIWLILIALTLLTLGIGEMGLGGVSVVAFILLTTIIKSQMIVNYFMGLRRVKLFWRVVLFLYLLIVCGLIGLAYLMSIS